MARARDAVCHDEQATTRRKEATENAIQIILLFKNNSTICDLAKSYIKAQHLHLSRQQCRISGMWPKQEKRYKLQSLEQEFDRVSRTEIVSAFCNAFQRYTKRICTDCIETILKHVVLPSLTTDKKGSILSINAQCR